MPSDDEIDGIKRGFGRRLLATGKVAATAARLAARQLRGAHGEADAALGHALARELDQMKGMAMKVGQILSYFEGVLPAATHEALRQLQQGTRAVAFPPMAAVIEKAFGESLATLFEHFDPAPIASASIGQVYRAVYDGRPVAVKVQYPDIETTIEADFSRLRGIARLASAATAVDGAALVKELRARFTEECDYVREGRAADAFSTAFAKDADVLIPRSILERTRRTVLTMDWAEGEDFYGFIARAPQSERNAAAMILVRFAYRSLFELATLNADPHPGNYLFPTDRSVAFLDFGCVRSFAPAYVEAERRLARVVIEDRRAEFRDAVVATGMVPRPERFDFDVHWEMLCHQWQPYRGPHFRFTSEYLARGMAFSRPGNPNLRRLAIPPAWIWIQRLQWGLHAVLSRLAAEGDFRGALRPWLEAPLRPLSF